MGPTLPGTMDTVSYYGICSIMLTPTEFMVIGGESSGILGGTLVQAYSAETGEWDSWDDLSVSRWGHSCTRLGDQVIVAGGVSPLFTILASTTVLDLNTREQREVGQMMGPRAWFGMATIDGKAFAFGGMSPLKDQYSNILELDMEIEEWVEREDTMATAQGISSFASVVVQQSQICGP